MTFFGVWKMVGELGGIEDQSVAGKSTKSGAKPVGSYPSFTTYHLQGLRQVMKPLDALISSSVQWTNEDWVLVRTK